VELIHEIFGETLNIAFNCLYQSACLYSIESRQVVAQHDLVTANQINFLLDNFYGNSGCRVLWHWERISDLINTVKLNISTNPVKLVPSLESQIVIPTLKPQKTGGIRTSAGLRSSSITERGAKNCQIFRKTATTICGIKSWWVEHDVVFPAIVGCGFSLFVGWIVCHH